jgi:hypothetical protein
MIRPLKISTVGIFPLYDQNCLDILWLSGRSIRTGEQETTTVAEVTLEMLQGLVLRVLNEQRDTRREMNDVRTLVLGLVDQGQRLERRFGELKREVHEVRDDIELMLKAELMGRMGNFETRIDARLDELSGRIAVVEARPDDPTS